jgi:hypothetical protein
LVNEAREGALIPKALALFYKKKAREGEPLHISPYLLSLICSATTSLLLA